MTNIYLDYYIKQGGSGIGGFQGYRYQKGSGIFDTIGKFVAPVAKFVGKHALAAGAHTLGDVLEKGMSLKEAAKQRFIEEGKLAGKELLSRISGNQTGTGRKRKRAKSIKRRNHIKRLKHIKRKKSFKRKSLKRKHSKYLF